MRRLIPGATLIAVAAGLIACGDTSGPPTTTGVEFLAGAGLTDTVTAIPSQMLRVRVHGARAGHTVRFATRASEEGFPPFMWVAEAAAEATVMTDADGVAAVPIRFGSRSGQTTIEVSIPDLGLVDTASYEVLPGAPVEALLTPGNTLLQPGQAFRYRGVAVDRFRNPHAEPTTYEVVSEGSPIVLNGAEVQTTAEGIARVRATTVLNGQTFIDSALVAVVPDARIAWVNGALFVGRIHSGAEQQYASVISPSWDPRGGRLVYRNIHGLGIQPIPGTPVMLPTPGVSYPSWPEYSADGDWIYFHAEVAPDQRKIHRVRRNGNGMEALTDEINAEAATPSPDGTSIAYVSGDLLVRQLAGNAVRLPNTAGAVGPRWSPDGQWIAYVSNTHDGALLVIRPDGTDRRIVGQHNFGWGISWSPDSRWVIGSSGFGSLTVADVHAGLSYPLPQSGSHPTWAR